MCACAREYVCVCVFQLMRGRIQVLTLERNSLMCVILEMQMTAQVHIHRRKMESSSVLITRRGVSLSVSTLSRRDWKVGKKVN